MKAVHIERYGGPEVLQIRDLPRPEPAPGEVLVRVSAAGINFMDIGTRQGRYEHSRTYAVRLPCTLGMEGAGEVVALGTGVNHLAVGDRVAWCLSWGSFAEYACVPAALAARLPAAISFEQAAAAMFQGCTAHYLVHDVAQLKAGSTCLVHAAAGSIGQILVQMAKHQGATVIATASSPEKREIATQRGADVVLPYDNFANEVRKATGGRGVDVVFDSVGLTTLRESFQCTRTQGLVISYGSVSGSVKDLDPLELGEAGSLFLTRPRLGDHMKTAEIVQSRADDVFNAIARGELTIEVAQRYALEDVGRAHAKLEAREQIGKPVALIDL